MVTNLGSRWSECNRVVDLADEASRIAGTGLREVCSGTQLQTLQTAEELHRGGVVPPAACAA
jgi:hypothetical protein